MSRSVGKLNPKTAALFVCDIQVPLQTFLAVLSSDSISATRLIPLAVKSESPAQEVFREKDLILGYDAVIDCARRLVSLPHMLQLSDADFVGLSMKTTSDLHCR